jgi:hypothetical protein
VVSFPWGLKGAWSYAMKERNVLCRTQSLLQLLMPVTTSLKTRIHLGGALMNAIGAQTEAYNTTPRGVQVWRGLPWDASTKFDRCQAGVSACVLGLGVLARIMWEKDLHFFTAHPRMDIICDRMKANRINGKQSLQKILWVAKTPGGLAVVTTWF